VLKCPSLKSNVKHLQFVTSNIIGHFVCGKTCHSTSNFVYLGQPTSTPFGFHTRPANTTCGLQQYVCKNLRCVDKAQICNFKNDCGDNSDELPCGTNCTFEGDCYKGWRQSTGTDNFNWRRKKGKTPSVGTGPITDHTLGTANVSSLNLHLHILLTQLSTFPYRISWENLIKDQSIFSLVIILLILIMFSLDCLLALSGENLCWSLLRLKGLK